MKGYDVRAIAIDIYPDEKWADENNVVYTDLNDIYRNADIITLYASVQK